MEQYREAADPHKPSDGLIAQPHTGALDTLRPMAAVASGIMAAFIGYNLVEFPPGVREIMAVHDAITSLLCAAIWWFIRRGTFREEQAHAVGTGMILIIASNILLSMWLLREPFHAIYLCILLVGTGAAMTSVAWGLSTILLLWIATIPLLFAVAEHSDGIRYMMMMGATSAVAMALIALRARNLKTLAHLTALDREQRLALKHALADLDAKVSLRTAELQAANAALQTQMDERARAEREARQLSEQLLHAQRLESLGRLAGGVAHDFNNLLTVIEGNLHLALDELPTHADRELLDEAIGASQRAAHLTRQLLAFGRKQVIERTVVDIGKQVEDMARMLQRVLGERIALHVMVEEQGLWVNIDPTQIEQVLMNLAVNARDAMPTGGSLHVDVTPLVTPEHRLVRIRVKDSGVGMDDSTMERIFEPFFTTKGPGEGTGLGLATAYGVVQQHGGAITVISSPGAGATFDVLLPTAEPTIEPVRSVTHARPQAEGTETILLVEDEDAVRRVAERFLRREGYHVLAAAGGAEALQIAARTERPLALLFTDVMMPGMNGFELAEELRALQPDIKVMFVSGYTGDYLETQTGELPVGSQFLYKPYEPRRTAEIIRALLDERANATIVHVP